MLKNESHSNALCLNVYVDMVTRHSSRPMFFVNLHTFASTAFVFMHSIAVKFLGFLEENIEYFSICPHQTLMRN